jgi:hypothetical protein
MKHFLFVLMLSYSFVSFAQKDIVATGGDGSSSGGAVSFSVGQLAFSSASNSVGDINQGVQQPIEIFELTKPDFGDQSFNAILYPNPSATAVTLSISSAIPDANLEYQLTDVTGKIIKIGKISSVETTIDVLGLPQACYFVNVLTFNKKLKTFKLLKNQ